MRGLSGKGAPHQSAAWWSKIRERTACVCVCEGRRKGGALWAPLEGRGAHSWSVMYSTAPAAHHFPTLCPLCGRRSLIVVRLSASRSQSRDPQVVTPINHQDFLLLLVLLSNVLLNFNFSYFISSTQLNSICSSSMMQSFFVRFSPSPLTGSPHAAVWMDVAWPIRGERETDNTSEGN